MELLRASETMCKHRSLLEGFCFLQNQMYSAYLSVLLYCLPPQKTLPTLENQIREVLHKTFYDLQKHTRGTPTTESEKLIFLTDVSINIGFVIEQSEEVNMGVAHLKLANGQHGPSGSLRRLSLKHFENNTDKPLAGYTIPGKIMDYKSSWPLLAFFFFPL